MASIDRDLLPNSVQPKHYEISLFDLASGKPWSYEGIVKIHVNVKSAVREIILNTIELSLFSAQINGQSVAHDAITHNEESQNATISFPEEIPPSDSAVLEIRFQGTMNDKMCGFYRSRYTPVAPAVASVPRDDEHHYMFSTQFESCDARRAFPCFDEPALKATYDFEIELPEDQIAISNMPVKGERPGRSGRKIISFERTPVMSTYLLAWAVGDFEYVEDFTRRKYNGKSLPVRVYTTKGLKDQGRFALEHAYQVVDLFSEVFRIDYPLPKVDMLAVHEFSHGAMENWGLITYRTTAVLFDEKSSDSTYQKRVAYVVAHELAHQWFGNLVTMSWWSELWLNEGFATWVGWYAIQALHPDWEVWSQFVADSMHTAQNLDSLRSSHPIEVPVKNALEIDQVFDAISYLKGSSIIRMLANHLGEDVFLKGVSDYLKAHAYGNATTTDLWAAIGQASGTDVNHFMEPWIRKIGFPVVTVTEELGQIGVRQGRFLLTGDVKAEEDQTIWWVPLGLRTADSNAVAKSALTGKQETIRNVSEAFYKLNSGATGFYRTNYPPNRLTQLGKARDKLSTTDSIGLIGDAAALAISGEGTSASLLSLLVEYRGESKFPIWQQLTTSLREVRSIFGSNPAIDSGLKKLALELYGPAVEQIGWEYAPNENLLTGQLRALLITAAGGAGHHSTISKAKELFHAYASGNKDIIHPSLRLPIFRIAIENGNRETYEAVKKEYLTTAAIDGKELCLIAMGKVPSTDLAQDFLGFQFAGNVAVQDMHTGAISLAQNAKTRSVLWDFIKLNWTDVHNRLSGNMVVLDRFLKQTLTHFADQKVGEDISDFFLDKDTKGYDKGLAQIKDTIRRNVAYRKRDEELILEWLQAHGYA